MSRRPFAGLLLVLIAAAPAFADDPKLPDAMAFDKLVVDALRDVHNKGADLYNTTKDFTGSYRMYQGGLIAVKPLLTHRPAAQKLIDDGLAAAEREPGVAQKAFKLHETIEAVRANLKAVPVEIKKTPPVEIKKTPPVEIAPAPREKDM